MASRDKNVILEDFEWTDFWWDNRTVIAKTVLMIGDSQTRGMRPYFSQFCPDLKVDMFATSKCVDNPDYMRELKYTVDGYHYDIVFFSHGLHGWHLGIDDYIEKCGKILDYLKESAGRVIVESCLPVAVPGEKFILDTVRNGIVNERNAALKRLSEEKSMEYIDLYSMAIDRAEIRDIDGMHYNEKGYQLLARQLTERSSWS